MYRKDKRVREQVDVAPTGGGTSERTGHPPLGMVLHVLGGVRPPPRDDAACPWGGLLSVGSRLMNWNGYGTVLDLIGENLRVFVPRPVS